MPLKVLTMRVASIADASAALPGAQAPTDVTIVRLVPIPQAAPGADPDLPGLGATGALEVAFVRGFATAKGISYDQTLEVVIRKPGTT